MANVNCVVVAGNLTRDPELRHTAGGTPVCNMRIAHNDRAKIQGEWQDIAYYFDVTVWGNQGEACANHLRKGRGIVVQGKLTWSEWNAQDGSKRQKVEIVAFQVQWLPSRDGGVQGGVDYTPSSESSPAASESYAPAASTDYTAGGQDDDIPF